MLERLLAEIRSGGTLEVKSLSKRLGTTPQMVEALLQHLTRMGKLQVADNQCASQGCGGCSLSSACHPTAAMKMWKDHP